VYLKIYQLQPSSDRKKQTKYQNTRTSRHPSVNPSLNTIPTPLEPASRAQRSRRSVATTTEEAGPAREAPKTRRSARASTGASTAAGAGAGAGAGTAARAGTPLSRDLALQVLDSTADIAGVSQMARSDEKSTTTNTVRGVAVSLGLLRREVGDLAVLLAVARVAVEHHAGDALLDGRVELRDGVDHDGRALGVAGGDDDGVRALRGGLFENADCFVVSGGGCAAGEGVGADAGGVGASDTLAGDVVAVGLLEAVAGGWADGGSLGM